MTCVLRFNRVLSCTTVPRKASISVSFVLAGSRSSTCRSQLKGRRGERDQYRRSTKEADLGGVYQVMMLCQHRQGVLDVGLRLCCVLWNLDAKALQVGWRQVHVDQTQIHILSVLLLGVIVHSTIPGEEAKPCMHRRNNPIWIEPTWIRIQSWSIFM